MFAKAEARAREAVTGWQELVRQTRLSQKWPEIRHFGFLGPASPEIPLEAFPKEIDWDDEVHSNRGITAVAPLSALDDA